MNYSYSAYPFGRWIKWAITVFIILVLLVSTISTYNGFASAEQDVKSRWSQVENVMQSRADKIYNLVEVVKGYTKHEERVFGDIASARSILMNNTSVNNDEDIKNKLEADTKLANASRSMLLLVEKYPDLKANEQFSNLQTAIEGAENRVAVERKRFIEAVALYNTKVTKFPGNIFAKVLGFQIKDYFKASPGSENAPQIKF